MLLAPPLPSHPLGAPSDTAAPERTRTTPITYDVARPISLETRRDPAAKHEPHQTDRLRLAIRTSMAKFRVRASGSDPVFRLCCNVFALAAPVYPQGTRVCTGPVDN